MDRDTLGFPFGTASRSYPSRHKSRYAEVFEDFEEMKGEDELRTVYPCPFCVDDFDLLELCCHIDLEHSLEPKSGICPVCAVWVGTNMVDHITAQHGSIIKCFASLTRDYAQLKSRRYKDLYPSLSFLRCSKDIDDGQWHSFSDGLSPTISTSSSKAACDPFLSFLYGGAAAASAETENVGPDSSSEVSTEETHSSDTVIERDVVQPSLSDKDQTEKARRSGFVQELLMSTILDPDF
nr:protein DEHYDRATION-INDUCED 19 homolog 3 isoform X2 [Arachis hypogaea]